MTRMPKFGWTSNDSRESLLLEPFPIGRHGQSAAGMWGDTVAASTLLRISVSTAEPFSISDHAPHAIRVALGSVSIDELRVALIKLRDTLERLSNE